jgi:hypothetical protein
VALTVNLAMAQVPDTEGITKIFSLTGKVAAYDEARGALRFFGRKGDILVEIGESKRAAAAVWGITEVPQGLLVATGMGRKSLTAETVITLFPGSDGAPVEVFKHSGERSQVPFLRHVDGKVWLTYFESKYTTRTGFLDPKGSAPWKFTEVGTFRLGDVTDVAGESVVIGRPYGDLQGQDGDLTMIKNGERSSLPSYRGVRAATFFGGKQAPLIAIADGWHQNYGALAQGRVSILRHDATSGRYALEVIDNDKDQYGFSKLIALTIREKSYLVALGNKAVVLYGPEPEWRRTVVRQIVSTETVTDLALVDHDENSAWIAVVDGGLRLIRLPLS